MDSAPRNYSGLFAILTLENLMPVWMAQFLRLRIPQMEFLLESIIIVITFMPTI